MSSLIASLLFYLGFSCVCDAACPRGWAEIGSDCLYFASGHVSWVGAATACRKMNHSVLVTIDNDLKQNYINNIVSLLSNPTIHLNGFWVGGNDFGVEGIWRWEEGNRLIGPYTKWAPGNPNGDGKENCMAVGFSASNATETAWLDWNCNAHHNYICQQPGTPTGGEVIIG